MAITKTDFINYTRCPRYVALLNIKKDKLKSEITYEEYKKEEIVLPQEIQELVNKRNEARANKNWAESDKLRDELTSKGYLVKDSKEGTIVSKN